MLCRAVFLFCNKMLFLLILFKVSFANDTRDYFDNSLYYYRSDIKRSNLNETFFSSLESYQVNATAVPEDKYRWIARVVHSKHKDKPHVCTATCVQDGVFITAARCIIGLKVRFTTVFYQSHHLNVRAFIVPSNGTKQAFDDIGFIVVQNSGNVTWYPVQLFDEKNRTDDAFEWFGNMDDSEYIVVGYATEKGIHRIKSADRMFNLTELKIFVGLEICSTILTFHNSIDGFQVPCYHSCTVEEFDNKETNCKNYHGVEGGAVLDIKKRYLLGLATWGPYFWKYELPVGFSVVNSANFFQDYECAKRIWEDDTQKVTKGYYQKLCE